MRCRGFTLIEMLVSISIFVVASGLMFGALFGATDVFRRGEAARQSGDEAMAVLAKLRSDLSRAVPITIRDGRPAPEAGWTYLAVRDAAGNCVLSFVIENPDPVATGADGKQARQIVTWFVDDPGTPNDASDDHLRRAVFPWNPQGARGSARSPTARAGELVTIGCLHFGVWAELALTHRQVSTGPTIGWEASHVPPYQPEPGNPGHIDSGELVGAVGSPNAFYPQPDALRISLVLTGGGRFATRGTLVTDINNATDLTARISGIKALPTISGSLLRIGDEWVRYDDFRKGQVTINATGRGALRSTASPHNNRPTVLAGLPFSLVVALPR
jgi:prepilin-type N-terminal cleavage/methylation domain-containing protein